jgi:transposase
MAPKFVAPYRMSGKRGKNDAADAMAICEAAQRPNMRFVPVKSQDEQARLCVHRVRQGLVEQRTATINRIRGLLSEFGIVLPQKAATVRREATLHLEDLPGWANTAVGDSLSELHRLDERIAEYDHHVVQMAREDERRGASAPLTALSPPLGGHAGLVFRPIHRAPWGRNSLRLAQVVVPVELLLARVRLVPFAHGGTAGQQKHEKQSHQSPPFAAVYLTPSKAVHRYTHPR